MQKVFMQNALRSIADHRLTGVYWIWDPDTPVKKKGKNPKAAEKAGKTDMGGKESASGAVPLFILIYHNDSRGLIISLFFLYYLC